MTTSTASTLTLTVAGRRQTWAFTAEALAALGGPRSAPALAVALATTLQNGQTEVTGFGRAKLLITRKGGKIAVKLAPAAQAEEAQP